MKKSILTKREKEVFNLLIKNQTTEDIANKLLISEKTVRNHISNVMQKLGVKGRAQAVVELLKIGEMKVMVKGEWRNGRKNRRMSLNRVKILF